MNRAALLALTWGTILAAVASAMLLAAHGDDSDGWGLGRDAATPASRPAAGPAMSSGGANPGREPSGGENRR